MRVTGRMLAETLLNNLNENLVRLERSQQQASSGKEISKPSDNPVALAQALGLQGALGQNKQYMKNVDAARTWLNTTDTSFGAIISALQRAQELATQGGTDSMSNAQLEGIGREVEELIGSAVQAANANLEGRYIFAGTQTSTVPFSYAPGGASVTYSGDGNKMKRQVGLGTTIDVNIPGNQALPAVFSSLIALRDGLVAGDSAAVRGSITSLDAALDGVLQAQAEVGARANRLEYVSEQLGDIQLDVEALLSKVQDVDLTEAITNLRAEEIAYQAALAIGGRTIQPSLLDYLR